MDKKKAINILYAMSTNCFTAMDRYRSKGLVVQASIEDDKITALDIAIQALSEETKPEPKKQYNGGCFEYQHED